MPSSRRSSQPRDQTLVSCFQADPLLSEPPGKLHKEETDSQLWGLIPGIAICLSGSRKKKKNWEMDAGSSGGRPSTAKVPRRSHLV